jgi:hypothetical protein
MDPATGVPFRRNINFLHQVEPETVSLEQYTEVTNRELAGVTDYKQSSLIATNLSGQPAMRIIYSGVLPGTTSALEVMSEWTVIHGRPWLVTHTSDPSRFQGDLPAAEQLFASIRLPTG